MKERTTNTKLLVVLRLAVHLDFERVDFELKRSLRTVDLPVFIRGTRGMEFLEDLGAVEGPISVRFVSWG